MGKGFGWGAFYDDTVSLDLLTVGLCSHFYVGFGQRISNHTSKKARLLKFLVDEGHVKMANVEKIVHEYLLEMGEEMHLRHLRTEEFPDHLGSDAVFGYALKHEKIHPADVKFDHGEIAGEYVVASDGLLESVVEQLLTYKDPEPHNWPSSKDTCCAGCCC